MINSTATETKGCHNCGHHYMNHKPCNAPTVCSSGSQWISQIKSNQPVIHAKAYYQYETYTDIQVDNSDLPDEFRLNDIEIRVKGGEK